MAVFELSGRFAVKDGITMAQAAELTAGRLANYYSARSIVVFEDGLVLDGNLKSFWERAITDAKLDFTLHDGILSYQVSGRTSLGKWPWLWFFLGLFTGVFMAWFLFDLTLFLISRDRPRQYFEEALSGLEFELGSQGQGQDQIECPMCAEKIMAKARKCKHCGHDLTDSTQIDEPITVTGVVKPSHSSALENNQHRESAENLVADPQSTRPDIDSPGPVGDVLVWLALIWYWLWTYGTYFMATEVVPPKDVADWNTASLAMFAVIMFGLLLLDVRRLREAGHGRPLGLWILLPPVYLFLRAKALGHGIVVSWCYVASLIFLEFF